MAEESSVQRSRRRAELLRELAEARALRARLHPRRYKLARDRAAIRHRTLSS